MEWVLEATPPRANKRLKHSLKVAVNSLPTMLKTLLNGPTALIPGDDSEEHSHLLFHRHSGQSLRADLYFESSGRGQ
jgi:hypothetical protein